MVYLSPASINASLGFGEVLTYVNTITNSWISNMFLLGIYVIILMGFYKAKDDFSGAMAVAGYGTFVISLFFWVGGFISGWSFGIVIGLAILGTAILMMDHN